MLIIYENNIKSCLYFIMIFLLTNALNAQYLEKIKNTDTLYVYFKKDNYNQMKGRNNVVNRDNYTYYLYFNTSEKDRFYYMLFNHYLISPEVRWEKKSFLKKKKDIIVDYDFLNKLGFGGSKQLLLSKKKLYVIDRDNFCKSKIKIVEVKISDVNLAPIE